MPSSPKTPKERCVPRDTLKFDFARGIPVLSHALLHKIESERQHGTLVAAESAKGHRAKSIHGLRRKKTQVEREKQWNVGRLDD